MEADAGDGGVGLGGNMNSGGLPEEGKRNRLVDISPQEAVTTLKAAFTPAMFAELTTYFQGEFSQLRPQPPDWAVVLHSFLLEFKRQALHPGYSKSFLAAFLAVYPSPQVIIHSRHNRP